MALILSEIILIQGESVQRRHGFVLAAIMAGNEIHHDHSLADVYEAEDAKGVSRPPPHRTDMANN